MMVGGIAYAAPQQPGGDTEPAPSDPCEHIASSRIQDADYDGDGLSGYHECTYGTNPHRRDTDNDALSDFDELWLGTDPTNWDTDGDQIEDGWEHKYANKGVPTDPLVAGSDSDGDLLADDIEIYYGLDPYNQDSDQDMWWDNEEILPLRTGKKAPSDDEYKWQIAVDPDWDNDGLVDGVEVKSLGTKYYDPDSDADGFSDGDEVYKYDTDPLDSADHPPVSHP